MSQIAQNLEEVRRRMAAAARRAGRDPGQVRLVAVSKTVPVELIRQAVAAGQRLFGENYLQEARGKIEALGEAASWHFIGHLQSNKAKAAVNRFELIHGVDRLKLARALDAAAASAGTIQKILMQVNLAGEASKSGTSPEAAAELQREISQLPHLRLVGLMTMPPFLDPEAVRPYFRALRELRDGLQDLGGTPLPELSMGMSGDFEVAIEEGATLVRVGTAIFGSRVL
ncbi:MAG: YggS family pyridoxal phosphate-dependent enzyme [Desulfobaccales bacterium]